MCGVDMLHRWCYYSGYAPGNKAKRMGKIGIDSGVSYTTKPRYQKSIKRATKMYLRLKDKKELMAKCGDAALILYEFYMSKAGVEGYGFYDIAAAEALGWNVHKVKTNRLKLTKSQFFKQCKGKLNDGRRVVITYLEPEYIQRIMQMEKDPELLSKLLSLHEEIENDNDDNLAQ